MANSSNTEIAGSCGRLVIDGGYSMNLVVVVDVSEIIAEMAIKHK